LLKLKLIFYLNLELTIELVLFNACFNQL